MITIDEIKAGIRKYETFNIVPDRDEFPCYFSGYVFDIDKSVRWNKEQVDIANKKRVEEGARLKEERNKVYNEFVDIIIAYIIQETDCTSAESNIIYNYVHERYISDDEAYCFTDVLIDTINFYKDLKKAKRREER